MNNTTLGSMQFGCDHTSKSFEHAQVDSDRTQVAVLATIECPLYVAGGDALKGGFVRPHDPFPVINTPMKIFLSKLETRLLHT